MAFFELVINAVHLSARTPSIVETDGYVGCILLENFNSLVNINTGHTFGSEKVDVLGTCRWRKRGYSDRVVTCGILGR